MTVVDAHVHIFPDEIVQHRERFIERDRWFAQLYSPERARLATMDELIAFLTSNCCQGRACLPKTATCDTAAKRRRRAEDTSS